MKHEEPTIIDFLLFRTDYKSLALLAWLWSFAVIFGTVGVIFWLYNN